MAGTLSSSSRWRARAGGGGHADRVALIDALLRDGLVRRVDRDHQPVQQQLRPKFIQVRDDTHVHSCHITHHKRHDACTGAHGAKHSRSHPAATSSAAARCGRASSPYRAKASASVRGGVGGALAPRLADSRSVRCCESADGFLPKHLGTAGVQPVGAGRRQ